MTGIDIPEAVVLLAACAAALSACDSIEPEPQPPGSVIQFVRLPDSVALAPMLVHGDSGQVAIQRGVFTLPACAEGLPSTMPGLSGDTVTFTLTAPADTTPDAACAEGPQRLGYAALLGQLPAGEYQLRLVHEGQAEGIPPLDSLFPVTVEPGRNR